MSGTEKEVSKNLDLYLAHRVNCLWNCYLKFNFRENKVVEVVLSEESQLYFPYGAFPCDSNQ